MRVSESFKKKNSTLLSLVFSICHSPSIGDRVNTSLVRQNGCKVFFFDYLTTVFILGNRPLGNLKAPMKKVNMS